MFTPEGKGVVVDASAAIGQSQFTHSVVSDHAAGGSTGGNTARNFRFVNFAEIASVAPSKAWERGMRCNLQL